MEPSFPREKNVIIIGAGIIGASIAHQLSLLNQPATILEQTAIACAASGKAAGFLAADWSDHTPLRNLTHLSYQMHAAYANAMPDIPYRTLPAYSACINAQLSSTSNSQLPSALTWLDADVAVTNLTSLGMHDTCAQVHPRLLTEALLAEAENRVGTRVEICRVHNVRRCNHNKWAVSAGQKEYICDVLVIAMGPWSKMACQWFKQMPRITSTKVVSLVGKANITPVALFGEYTWEFGTCEPDIYIREGEVYLCRWATPVDLPETAEEVTADADNVNMLRNFGRTISSVVGKAMDGQCIEQACYMPNSEDELPIIGELPGSKGVFIATAHWCWGILNSAATGLAIAQLIVRGETSIDIEPFRPERFK